MAETAIELTSGAKSVREGLRRALRGPPFDRLAMVDRSNAEIVLAEVLNNIAEHAYAGRPGPIRLWVAREPGRLCLRVEDEGRPMPGHRLPPDRLPAPGELAEGGFGWHLIRALASDLRYDRCGSLNRLCFHLRTEQSAG
ncbi:ATP-binding protein [Pseudogemmobacter blasticus]|uniref:ATP-binding protein n=1 Tax=Fuscovulum blasticum DSM 2131 TaxID=1188250 RepID=A0A2T4JEK6_FUSBL|nr:ATP-binding protein [Fuscovulum blasticum]PTE16352.1 ATP-binding protein [Fuscovulum blasticum DSM 2131]